MFHYLSNWWNSSSTSSTTMVDSDSSELLNQARLEAREGRREMFNDNTSGAKDMIRDRQGSSQSGSHREESKLHGVAPPMVVAKPESSHPRGRPASGPCNAKDQELAAPTQRGTGHVQQDRKHSEVVRDRVQKEPGYTRTGKEEVRRTKDTELLSVQAEVEDLRIELRKSERQRILLSKILDDERRGKRDLQNIEASKLSLAPTEAHVVHQKLHQMEKENSQKSKALDIATKEIETLRNDMGKARRQIEDLRTEVDATHHQIDDCAVHYNRQKQELHAIKEQLERAEVVHQQTREQLTERTAELQNAQRFIDVADSLSGADIINMTTALNAEILQSAALMADSLDYTKRQGETPNEVLLDLQKNIGENLTQALIHQRFVDRRDIDPTLVQLALQVCLVYCSRMIVTSWTLEGNDERLSEVYSRIWNEGKVLRFRYRTQFADLEPLADKQSVAGRWRSMTQMHAATTRGPGIALQMILRAVESVLVVTRTNYRPCIDQFQERLSTINTLSLHLRSSIGQCITSMDIRPLTFKAGVAFDPSIMGDTYTEERKSNSMAAGAGGPIAGSTELGLISRVKAIDGKVETKVMLKPKVVLCSVLTEDD